MKVRRDFGIDKKRRYQYSFCMFRKCSNSRFSGFLIRYFRFRGVNFAGTGGLMLEVYHPPSRFEASGGSMRTSSRIEEYIGAPAR